jgi:hypothetical protein
MARHAKKFDRLRTVTDAKTALLRPATVSVDRMSPIGLTRRIVPLVLALRGGRI